LRNEGPELVPLNPSGREPDLDLFNSKNRLTSVSLFIMLLVLTMCDFTYCSSCSFYYLEYLNPIRIAILSSTIDSAFELQLVKAKIPS
jgi:hypothetical protein